MSWSATTIRGQYSRFLNDYPNLLFANHSHQAWPNVARFGQLKAFDLAASDHGSKWHEIEMARTYLKKFISSWIGNDDFGGEKGIVWEGNTFQLLASFLSSLNLSKGSVVITSDSEFHSMRRLLSAYEEKGLSVVRVSNFTDDEVKRGVPGEGFFARLHKAISNENPANLKAVMFSSVSFRTGNLLPGFEGELTRLLSLDTPVLVDMYHQTGTKTFKVPSMGQENLFLVGGGYKYMQMGEGNCWMRTPVDCDLRPTLTGWYAEMEELTARSSEGITYPRGAERFRGATYDGTSVMRGKEVASFFKDIGFTPESLQNKYQADVTYIYERLKRLLDRLPEDYKEHTDLALLSHSDEDLRAGFVSLRFRDAGLLHGYLLKNFIETDYRSDVIRFGPAPYTMKEEMDRLLDMVTEYFEGEL